MLSSQCLSFTYLSSLYTQAEGVRGGSPPFFESAPSFFSWVSQWCRYMMMRVYDRGIRTNWQHMLFSCRTAVRSVAGLEVAEFVLPLLVLDSLCYGDADDEVHVCRELNGILRASTDQGLVRNLPEGDLSKAIALVFSTLEVLQRWAEKEIDDKTSRRRSSRKNRPSYTDSPAEASESWSAENCVERISDLLSRVSLDLRATAASSVEMHTNALRYLELSARSKMGNSTSGSHSQRSSEVVSRSALRSRRHVHGVDANLLRDVLEGLGDFETFRGFAFTQDAMGERLDSVREKQSRGDWIGAWNLSAKQLQQHRQGSTESERKRMDLRCSGLDCLLRIGQYETVLNQVNGFILDDREKNSSNDKHNSVTEARNGVIPFAVEAAWQLGQWESISTYVDSDPDTTLENRTDYDGAFRVAVGKALLSLYKKSEPQARLAIGDGRRAIMAALSNTAGESYNRAYPALVRLQSLQDVEDVVCRRFERRDNGGSYDSLSADAAETGRNGWVWKDRLDLVANTERWCVANVRVGLARVFHDHSMEVSLFLKEAKRTRKKGLSQMASTALSNAKAKLNMLEEIGRKETALGQLPQLSDTLNEHKVQLAKLERQLGRTGNALNILDNQDVRGWLKGTDSEIQAMVEQSENGGNVEQFVKRLLLSTEWIADSGLRGVSEIMERYRVATKLQPNLEKGEYMGIEYPRPKSCAVLSHPDPRRLLQ